MPDAKQDHRPEDQQDNRNEDRQPVEASGPGHHVHEMGGQVDAEDDGQTDATRVPADAGRPG